MERDKPAAEDLLETARTLLREEVIQHVPPAHKLNILMVANAMAIASRELEGVPALEAAAMEDLRALYPEAADVELSQLTERFAGDIRQGAFDDDAAAYRALFENTRRRIALSNPRYLATSKD